MILITDLDNVAIGVFDPEQALPGQGHDAVQELHAVLLKFGKAGVQVFALQVDHHVAVPLRAGGGEPRGQVFGLEFPGLVQRQVALVDDHCLPVVAQFESEHLAVESLRGFDIVDQQDCVDVFHGLFHPFCDRVTRIELQQVPQVAVEVGEHGHHAVVGLFGLADEFDPFRGHGIVVAPEVVGVEEEEHPSAGLVADEGLLFRLGRARQQQRGAFSTRWRDHHPAFVLLRLVGIFDQLEIKLAHVKIERFVIVFHHQGDVNDGLLHNCCRPYVRIDFFIKN